MAEVVADDWIDNRAEPLVVFITAYDHFAILAFERAAVDHLLKPATAYRLRHSVARLKARPAERAAAPPTVRMAARMQRMQSISMPQASGPDSSERIKVVRARVGSTVRMSLRELMARDEPSHAIRERPSAPTERFVRARTRGAARGAKS